MKQRRKILACLMSFVMMAMLVAGTFSSFAAGKAYAPVKMSVYAGNAMILKQSYQYANKTLTVTNKSDGGGWKPATGVAFLPASDNNALLLNLFGGVPAYALSDMISSGKINKVVEKNYYLEWQTKSKYYLNSTNTYSFTKNGSGKVTRIVVKSVFKNGSPTETLTFNLVYLNDRLTALIETNGTQTETFIYRYNSKNKITSMTQLGRKTTRVSYNSKGYPNSIDETSIKCDSKGRITRIYTLATSYSYNANGKIAKVLEEDAIGYSFTYKAL